MSNVTMQSLTREELDQEIKRYEHQLRMPLEQATALEPTGHLSFEQFAALERLRILRWLAEDDE